MSSDSVEASLGKISNIIAAAQLVSRQEPTGGTLEDYPNCGWRRLDDFHFSISCKFHKFFQKGPEAAKSLVNLSFV